MSIITSGDISEITLLLKQMAMFETKIAEMYSLCASTFDGDRQFWLDIWRDEIKHAQYIIKIINIVSARPQYFEKGRPYNVFTIQTVVMDIENRIEMIKKGETTKEKVLFFANDLEQGFIEAKYAEIVISGDMEYRRLMQSIIDDTSKHQKRIADKIKEIAQGKDRR